NYNIFFNGRFFRGVTLVFLATLLTTFWVIF
ncbi:MAG: hypothetical protein ACI9NY_001190, partial [Kiritimatiellia bacterium]